MNEYLFAAMDAVTNGDLEGEALERELARAKAVTDIASTIIANGELALKAVKMADGAGMIVPNENAVTALLGGGSDG